MKKKIFENNASLTLPEISSKKTLIDWIKALVKHSDNPNDLKALEGIVNEIGKCGSCQGAGKIIVANKPENNYGVLVSPRGIKWYTIPCKTCAGKGNIVSIVCSSCGKEADIMPYQRHYDYCQTCEDRLINSGFLI